MICEGCGAEAPAMKTVRWRTGERRFVLCDPCYAPISGSLWIVPCAVNVAAKCLSCGTYLHPEDMASLTGGGDGKWDVLAGTCPGCTGGQTCDNGGGGLAWDESAQNGNVGSSRISPRP